jgi:hypothetical protein
MAATITYTDGRTLPLGSEDVELPRLCFGADDGSGTANVAACAGQGRLRMSQAVCLNLVAGHGGDRRQVIRVGGQQLRKRLLRPLLYVAVSLGYGS